jgi:hypothetical protein
MNTIIINTALVSLNKIGPCKILRPFFKYLKCKLGWTWSIPVNVGTHSTHRCTHTPTKATTCRIDILGRRGGGRERKTIHARSKLISAES